MSYCGKGQSVQSYNKIRPNWSILEQNRSLECGLWSAICDVWKISKEIKLLVRRGIRLSLGDRRNTCFLEDL